MMGVLAWMVIASMAREPEGAIRELLPGVRVGAGIVEFEGTVCADLTHGETDVVFLELLVTGPDSREHESLVVTKVTPSAIHAGLLAAGFGAGSPAKVDADGTRRGATGDAVRVRVRERGADAASFVDLASWVVSADGARRLVDAEGWGLVFAGSRTDARGYAADKTGTVVGLTGFGTEVIGAAWALSPEASVDEPVWVVDGERTPRVGTGVVIRITGAGERPSVVDDRDAGDAESE